MSTLSFFFIFPSLISSLFPPLFYSLLHTSHFFLSLSFSILPFSSVFFLLHSLLLISFFLSICLLFSLFFLLNSDLWFVPLSLSYPLSLPSSLLLSSFFILFFQLICFFSPSPFSPSYFLISSLLCIFTRVRLYIPEKDGNERQDAVVVNKAACTPEWHGARFLPRGTPVDNEDPELSETFHTDVAWRAACATGDLSATPRLDTLVLFSACDLPPRTASSNFKAAFTDKVIISQGNIKILNTNNKTQKMKLSDAWHTGYTEGFFRLTFDNTA